MKKSILAALLLFALASTGHAACVKYAADGTEGPCPTQAHREPVAATGQGSANPCQLGGLVAYKAYLEGTYDAQRPDNLRLAYMVGYWGDMMIVKYDKAVALKAVEYIAARLKPTGMRKPWDGAVYEAAREFIVKECK
jgi:hypothetical protein